MLRLPAVALISALTLSVAAHADTTDNFSFTGTDASSNPYTIDFSLNPANYTNPYDSFLYTDVSGTVDGVSDMFSVNFNPDTFSAGSELVSVYDSSTFLQVFEINADVIDGDPTTGNPPTVTTGVFATIAECTASLHAPTVGMRLPTTLAFFQSPSLSINCGAAGSLSVTPSTASVTPEPGTLALLGTGALGVVGVVRRRIRS